MQSKAPPIAGIGMTSARTRERLVQRLREQGIRNEAVLERFRVLPRHQFVDEALATRAYEDNALPIGFGQTISQPYVVARMTEALLEHSPRKVLEIGTGCGYQTAVLAPLVVTVYSIERIGALLDKAKQRFKELQLRNITVRHGDGFKGWAAHAPYDAILMAAAPQSMPRVLLDQLSPNGGRLIAPVGPDGRQELVRITRKGDELQTEKLGIVSFVPLLKGLG
ncbi:MAG TPA: protein-L-isoaspartate(D-aspartate) O-methyltransferase [Roseiflexaceae bacterium]|nr:protein-L-isoaspartate(D-aspartate) O-methyltransferase [Roseiflexaceae bacterium]